jgi:hypothetical protein
LTYNNHLNPYINILNASQIKININYTFFLKNNNTNIINHVVQNIFKVNLNYLTNNLFKTFFTRVNTEVPKVLLNLKALNNPSNQIILYKVNNYLTLHNNFIKSITTLNKAWFKSFNGFSQSIGFNHK